MSWLYRLSLVAFLMALPAPPLLADTVYLKNGQKFEGRVEIKEDEVILYLEGGSKLPFPREKVERIERGPVPWEVYRQKAAEIEPGDAAGHLALARWCREKKLSRQMDQELAAVLKVESENAEVHRMLGHEKVGGKWLTRIEALKAKGYVLVEGRWLNPREYAEHKAKNKLKEAREKELARLRALAEKDPNKAAQARKHYLDRGKGALQNLIWAATNLNHTKARLEACKLINQIGITEQVHSIWMAQAALKESDRGVLNEICAGIKKRGEETALTYLVLTAAVENPRRRKAALCLRIINDKRCFKALIGCVARQPKNTLPGQTGMNLATMGSMAGGTGAAFGGSAIAAEEVVPAADSLEYLSGKGYKNDINKWIEWLESLDKGPGGAVVNKKGN